MVFYCSSYFGEYVFILPLDRLAQQVTIVLYTSCHPTSKLGIYMYIRIICVYIYINVYVYVCVYIYVYT